MAQDMTRRERQAVRRRQQILEAAAQVFAERGYHRATTRDIAEAADVAEGTIYNYFASKDDLLMGLIGEMAELSQQQTMLDEALDQDLDSFIKSYLVYRLGHTGPYQRLLMGIVPELVHHPELRDRYRRDFVQPALIMIEDHVRRRIERGQIRDVDAPVITRLLMGMLLGMQLLIIIGEPVIQEAWEHADALAETITGMIMDGVRRRP
jgi:AcrR family transcriptional regulator